MDDEVGSLQPWQIYSALYLAFYVISVYFDHFLISFVFCIAFGVISEIVTKYMAGDTLSYSAAAKREELNSLVCMAQKEASLAPTLTQMAKVEATRAPEAEELILNRNEEIWGRADQELEEEEEEAPPPLPQKDYLMEQETSIQEVASRLSTVPSAHQQEEEEEEEEEESEIEEIAMTSAQQMEEEEEEESEIEELTSEQELNAEVLRHVSEGHCPVISDLQNQDLANTSTENIRSMSEISGGAGDAEHTEKDSKQEQEKEAAEIEQLEVGKKKDVDEAQVTDEMIDTAINMFSTRVQEDEEEEGGSDNFIENDVTEAEAKYVENNITRGGGGLETLNSPDEVETKDEKKFYAPDSSSDEELDDEYETREVELGETESSEEEDEYKYSKGSVEPSPANPIETDIRERDAAAVSSDIKGEGLLLDVDVEPIGHIINDVTVDTKPVLPPTSSPAVLIPEVAPVPVTVTVTDPVSDSSKEDFSDLDLNDPQLELAATKIQSVFKGFQARKKSGGGKIV